MNYRGTIIEESLENKDVLKDIQIISTKVERVTEKHRTPWLEQWTLLMVEIPEEKAAEIAERICRVIDAHHAGSWYVDFKNDVNHFIVFHNKVFRVDRSKREQYEEAIKYGISLGIPDYQLDFAPDIKERRG